MHVVATAMTYSADAGGIIGGLASAAALGALLRKRARKRSKGCR